MVPKIQDCLLHSRIPSPMPSKVPAKKPKRLLTVPNISDSD